MTKAEFLNFVRTHRRDKYKWLWRVAESAPFGAYVISTDNTNPYLMRVYLTPSLEDLKNFGSVLSLLGVRELPRIYLHFFFRGDLDRELHNHPKRWALSLILTGGYSEERWDPLTRRVVNRLIKPLSLNTIRKMDFHRVTLLRPQDGCWTLFVSHGREQPSNGYDWGFFNTATETYIPWGEYHHEQDNDRS